MIASAWLTAFSTRQSRFQLGPPLYGYVEAHPLGPEVARRGSRNWLLVQWQLQVALLSSIEEVVLASKLDVAVICGQVSVLGHVWKLLLLYLPIRQFK